MPIFLKIVRYSIGIFYFIIDNILWLVHVGVTIEYFNQRLFEQIKDGLSLIRYLLRMSIFLLTIFERKLLEKTLFQDLYRNSSNIEENKYEVTVLDKLLATRKKIRFQSLEMIINVLRIIKLVKSLKLPGYTNISPIFSSNCGIISGAFSLFKLLTRSNLS